MSNQIQQTQQQTDQPQRPHKDLDLYQEAVNPSLTEEFLNNNNLGLGNLTEAEVYQQIESYRAGMFADAALSDRIDNRRLEETKRALAEEGWTYINDNGKKKDVSGWNGKGDSWKESEDRRRYLERRGEEIWDSLPEEQQFEAIVEFTGRPDWMAPHYRMLLMRNEASKSKEARTQDNLFGRVKKLISNDDNGDGGGARERLRGLTGGGQR
ncbi:hypothetical protein HWV23_02735 [Natronomonas halophila]|uniref:hypothetical protein n=1 Tax=Natronomonas halophila TaxID=2747817 RepID=UPI0015B3B634|nr:hypothetical protein [Natronomonas halophila]QLD84618.1 hypothetical protein HWV23_02460 [Natronomonas halophila]QLD84672.1 hypothetical protein HWV23_02735 [Natronomonas halophila]